jgi:hypothetical protein
MKSDFMLGALNFDAVAANELVPFKTAGQY